MGVLAAQGGDISRAAGGAYGTFYSHFENTGAVLLEALAPDALDSAPAFFAAVCEAQRATRGDAPELEMLVRVYGTAAGPGRDEPAA